MAHACHWAAQMRSDRVSLVIGPPNDLQSPIRAGDVRAKLLDACSDLGPVFIETDEDLDERLTYLEIAAVVRWLVAKVSSAEDACLPAIFGVAEQCLANGTGETRTLITVGLFEDLQNDNMTEGVSSQVWERHLGPLSKSAWTAIAAFWQGDREALPRLFDEHDWTPSPGGLDRPRPEGEIGS
jgi:hypothetical protein